MYKVGIIGDKDSVMGFKTVGISVFDVKNVEEAEYKLHYLASESYAIIFVTENYALEMEKSIDMYKDERFPAIIPVPSTKGSLGFGMKNVKKSVERAVGADILFKEE